MTVSDPTELLSEALAVALRKKTVAAAGICEFVPDAIVVSFALTLANPEVCEADHWRCDLLPAEPIESVHDCVALTLSERPSVAVCVEETITAL
jgi:hypothetical protein